MTSSFDRWEKDPFFLAAEEVQESADRMESTYRTWMHAKKDASSMWNAEELCRDLLTDLGTTKWQLEEFQQAVGLSYFKASGEESRGRHQDFISAIEDNVSKIECSLQKSAHSEGKKSVPWVLLDEGERDELALFLSGSSAFFDKPALKNHIRDDINQQGVGKDLTTGLFKSYDSVGWDSKEASDEKSNGHRRSASASADIDAWKIAVTEPLSQLDSSHGQPLRPPRKVPSFSGLSGSMEYASKKIKWPKNGVRKWKAMDIKQESDTIPLHSSQLTKGFNGCYEKSKSCLNGCDEGYDKQMYGWYGVFQRQLQRSQYHMQYSQPVQLVLWIILFFSLIVLVAMRAR